MSLQPKSDKRIAWIMAGLGVWLACLLALASWYQAHYIHGFTDHNPKFLNADHNDQWFENLITQLPPKTSQGRVIQFWQPKCLCNRFALPHSLKNTQIARSLGVEHITIIPSRYQSDIPTLQALNPNTQLITLDEKQLSDWPASPSVLIEGPFSQLLYIGPLGYGAFCSQASTGVIEQQLIHMDKGTIRPFHNVVGKGCFCPWNE